MATVHRIRNMFLDIIVIKRTKQKGTIVYKDGVVDRKEARH